MIKHLIKRLLFIFLGHGLASAASGVVVAIAYQFSIGKIPPLADIPSILFMISALIAEFAAPPALLVVLFGEAKSVRNLPCYAAAGCLIGVGIPIYLGMDILFHVIGFAFGPVAGAIYWQVAGRNAGWRATIPAVPNHEAL